MYSDCGPGADRSGGIFWFRRLREIDTLKDTSVLLYLALSVCSRSDPFEIGRLIMFFAVRWMVADRWE